MKCSRCGATIGSSFARINGAVICDNCARELKIDEMFRRQNTVFEQAFPMLGELGGILGTGSDLDFANTKIRCQRCGTTLRELESTGQVGCIECYNTFNESVMKNVLKRQGSSEYLGRKPGEKAVLKIRESGSDGDASPASADLADSPKAASSASAPARTAAAAAAAAPAPGDTGSEAGKDVAKDRLAANEEAGTLEALKTADLSEIPDGAIEDYMKKAAATEDYALAARLRDELKSRKGDN